MIWTSWHNFDHDRTEINDHILKIGFNIKVEWRKKTNLVVVVALFGQPDFRFASSEILMDLVLCIDPVGEDFQLG